MKVPLRSVAAQTLQILLEHFIAMPDSSSHHLLAKYRSTSVGHGDGLPVAGERV
jgi:hypothetical protein